MSQIRSYAVKFRFKTGNDGYQTVIIQAPSTFVARKMFEQSNPGCIVSTVNEVSK